MRHPQFSHARSLLAPLAVVAALAACTTTPQPSEIGSNPNGKADGPGGKTGSGSTTPVTVECTLQYSDPEVCYTNTPRGCPSVQLGSIKHVVDAGYPTFNDTIGDSSVPYRVVAEGVPYPLADGSTSAVNGGFGLTVPDAANPNIPLAYSDGMVSLRMLTPGDDFEVVDLHMKVPEFTYQGQTWDKIDAGCSINAQQ
jgi:hypothetical protein